MTFAEGEGYERLLSPNAQPCRIVVVLCYNNNCWVINIAHNSRYTLSESRIIPYMSDMIDQKYLLNQQYTTSANLNIRIQLHERFSTNPVDWHRWVFDQFYIPAGGRVLELGGGSGALWQKNLERIPADWSITLSDFSSGMLDDARRNLGTSASRFQFAAVDAQAIPFAGNSFDCVIANHMLYHVPDRARAFAEIRRVLSPHGRFYAATNGEAHLREMKLLCERAGIAVSGVLNASAESPFSLQNGAAQMAPWFSFINLVPLENGLAVTEAEPLIAFILASVPVHSVDDVKLQALHDLINEELAEQGAVHITKEAGLFIAHGDAAL
jgi:SAM-dependent methyltransferase